MFVTVVVAAGFVVAGAAVVVAASFVFKALTALIASVKWVICSLTSAEVNSFLFSNSLDSSSSVCRLANAVCLLELST